MPSPIMPTHPPELLQSSNPLPQPPVQYVPIPVHIPIHDEPRVREVRHEHRTKGSFGTGFGGAFGCLTAIAVFCIVSLAGFFLVCGGCTYFVADRAQQVNRDLDEAEKFEKRAADLTREIKRPSLIPAHSDASLNPKPKASSSMPASAVKPLPPVDPVMGGINPEPPKRDEKPADPDKPKTEKPKREPGKLIVGDTIITTEKAPVATDIKSLQRIIEEGRPVDTIPLGTTAKLEAIAGDYIRIKYGVSPTWILAKAVKLHKEVE